MLIPIVAHPIGLNDLFFVGNLEHQRREFSRSLSLYLAAKHVFLLDSGTSSFYILLEVLRAHSEKDEVIIPAYTASPLVAAIQKAGLKPVLCDISLKDFCIDPTTVSGKISDKTLCIVGVHMFGIVSEGLRLLQKQFPRVPVIEDCCQSMGSVPAGNIGVASFYSFNRGKNLPTYGGGCIATNDAALAEDIKKKVKRVPEEGFKEAASRELKLFALAFAMRPSIYGLLTPFIAGLKEQAPPSDFSVRQYTPYQAGVGSLLLSKIDFDSETRNANGMMLIDALKTVDAVIVPSIAQETKPAFNRMPILFKDIAKREKAAIMLRAAGIETTRMYHKPLHHLFDLSYAQEDFPNACYFAEHLLTVPVHPLVSEKNIHKIAEIIKEAVR